MSMPTFLLALILPLTVLSSPASSIVPNASLVIAYRQVTDGKADRVILESQLTCLDGHCELVTVTLNWCLPGTDGSTVDVGRSSTSDGDLKVTGLVRDKSAVISAEDSAQGATIKYRFECSLRGSDPAGSRPSCQALTGFSGAAVKDSALLRKTISWELQPFKGARVPFKPDCPIYLHGIP